MISGPFPPPGDVRPQTHFIFLAQTANFAADVICGLNIERESVAATSSIRYTWDIAFEYSRGAVVEGEVEVGHDVQSIKGHVALGRTGARIS